MNTRAHQAGNAQLHRLGGLLAAALLALAVYFAWRGYFTAAMLMDWAVKFCG